MGIFLLSIAVNALLVSLVYLLARRRINRLLSGGEALDAIKDEINRLVVELNQTSDRNNGKIEERINRLQELIREADRKIMLLGKESEKVRLGTDVYAKLKKSKPLVSEERRRGTVHPVLEPVRVAGGTPAPLTVPAEEEQPKPATPAEEVLALHRQGFDPKIIAAKTDFPLGEIELIISLANGSR